MMKIPSSDSRNLTKKEPNCNIFSKFVTKLRLKGPDDQLDIFEQKY